MPYVYYGPFDVNMDQDPPYVTNRIPASGAVNVLISANVYFEIIDVGTSGVSPSTINVDFNGTPVLINSVFQAGFAGTITPVVGGYAVFINPTSDLPPPGPVIVNVTAQDLAVPANVVNDTWSFTLLTDGTPPHVENNAPVGLYRPLNEHITFDLIDTITIGVDPTSTEIRVDGAVAWTGLVTQNGFVVVVTPIAGGYSYDVTAPYDWTPGAIVTVEVDASDSINDMATFSWQFTGTLVGLEKCNPAPLIPVEVRLRDPFLRPRNEELRRHVLTIISRDRMLDHRIRGVLLTAHFNDFRPVFADVLAVPPPIFLEAICKRRKLFDLYRDLLPFQPTMHAAVLELQAQGLSQGYVQLIDERIFSHSPQQVVDAACAILLFAALLDLVVELTTIDILVTEGGDPLTTEGGQPLQV